MCQPTPSPKNDVGVRRRNDSSLSVILRDTLSFGLINFFCLVIGGSCDRRRQYICSADHPGLPSGTLRSPAACHQEQGPQPIHPRQNKLALPCNRALRYRRICSEDDQLDTHLNRTERTSCKGRHFLSKQKTSINVTLTLGGNILHLQSILQWHHGTPLQLGRPV